MGGGGEACKLLARTTDARCALGGVVEEEDARPKTVVSTEEAREVAVLGVGGREFSLMMEQRRELAVVVDSGRGTARAVMGVVVSEGLDRGDRGSIGAVMERLGGRGR